MNIDPTAPTASSGLSWRKSSYSGGEGGECIEIAFGPKEVHIRDSKDRQGPTLVFEAAEWARFVLFAAES